MKIEGACHCGAITYEAEIDPEKIAVCHCTDCQRTSGSPYRVGVLAPSATFKLSGTPKTYIKTAESGSKRLQAFCGHCGSPLYSSAVTDPPTYNLRLGSIRQRAALTPKRQNWCRSALGWSMNIEDLPRFERG